ncbi:hypothetical protein GOODEAATRI_032846 [Goodea atripinnis]|uniref:Uncharacterized protein n=1 Tax=Goodea atripinnis TaxID=208336 RepID=A0ABV0Q300_9TELE
MEGNSSGAAAGGAEVETGAADLQGNTKHKEQHGDCRLHLSLQLVSGRLDQQYGCFYLFSLRTSIILGNKMLALSHFRKADDVDIIITSCKGCISCDEPT